MPTVFKCNTCPCESHKINTYNKMAAQNDLVRHFKWKVYKVTEGLPQGQLWDWWLACPACVQKYAIGLSKQRKRNAQEGTSRS